MMAPEYITSIAATCHRCYFTAETKETELLNKHFRCFVSQRPGDKNNTRNGRKRKGLAAAESSPIESKKLRAHSYEPMGQVTVSFRNPFKWARLYGLLSAYRVFVQRYHRARHHIRATFNAIDQQKGIKGEFSKKRG